jgi:Lon protease-like protein
VNDLPLFPLGTVLFPGGLLPLRVFEQRYLEMAKACLRDGTPFGVCLIREGAEVGAPAVPVDIGCLARIMAWDMPQLGLLQVTAQGEQRFRILERHAQPDGLQRARADLLPPDSDAPIPEPCKRCVQLLERVIEQQSALFDAAANLESCSWVSSRLAEILPLPPTAKQELLELADARARLERINALLRG